MVRVSKQTTLLACRTRTAESCFSSKKNRRAGAQTNLSGGENLVEGEKCTHGPTDSFSIVWVGLKLVWAPILKTE